MIQVLEMRNHFIRKLLFHLITDDNLLFFATGWDKDDIDDPATATPANFLNWNGLQDPERAVFEPADHHLVHFIYDLLDELSLKTLQSKSAEIENIADELQMANVHNIPISMANSDQKFWAKKFKWDADELVTISMGFSLKPELGYKLQKLFGYAFNPNFCPFIKEYWERKSLLQSTGVFDNEATPLEQIKWLKKLEFIIPNRLQENVEYFQKPEVSKTVIPESNTNKTKGLPPPERKTALKLIAAMSIGGYSYDPQAARNEATSDIQKDLDLLGIGLDQKTILKWLREASGIVEKDYSP